jgi:hypothetical protein
LGIFAVIPITTGSGYSVGDKINVTGGTTDPLYSTYSNSILIVQSINGSGGVLSASVQNYGRYSIPPTNPICQLIVCSTTGGGSGAQFTASFALWALGITPPLQFGTTIAENLGIGFASLNSLTTGVQNTSLGWNTLSNCTTCQFNTAIGDGSQWNNQISGANNITLGGDTMRNASANNTIAIGVAAFRNPQGIGADFNIAIGTNAMLGQTSTTATGNIAIGYASMNNTSLTSAANNVCVGVNSCQAFTAAVNNTFIGLNTGQADITGSNNVGVGTIALQKVNTGGANTAVGEGALNGVTGSNFNTGFGFNAGLLITGANNLILGSLVASTTLTTGSRDILIGTSSNCDTPLSNTNDYFAICASSGLTHLLTGNLASGSLALTINGTITAPTLTTSLTGLAGSLCATVGGLIIYKSGANCF